MNQHKLDLLQKLDGVTRYQVLYTNGSVRQRHSTIQHSYCGAHESDHNIFEIAFLAITSACQRGHFLHFPTIKVGRRLVDHDCETLGAISFLTNIYRLYHRVALGQSVCPLRCLKDLLRRCSTASWACTSKISMLSNSKSVYGAEK